MSTKSDDAFQRSLSLPPSQRRSNKLHSTLAHNNAAKNTESGDSLLNRLGSMRHKLHVPHKKVQYEHIPMRYL